MSDAMRAAAERLRRLAASPEAQRACRGDLGPFPPQTLSGEPLEPVYSPLDLDPRRLLEETFPGAPPFTRGLHPLMYRQRPWTIRQYAGFGGPQETNARFRKLLAAGQTGLSVAFDLPTQLGLDPDDPRARGEVGRAGVSISAVDDLSRLFEGIDLGQVSTSMTINAPAAILLAFYQVLGEERGVPPERLRGTVQNDILKEYAARNNYIFPPAPSMGLTVELMRHCAQTLTGFHPLSVSGYHLREAGCTAVQELAFTLSNGLAYVEAGRKGGLAPERIGEQLSFFFAATTELLEEVAKFRAARRLWARLLQERFGVRAPKALQLRFHVQTSGAQLTSAQPENNLVRVAIQALAGVLGGCQSLHTNAFDEALGLPGERSARLAVNTQLMLAEEGGVSATADPLGGAYAVEALTDQLERRALELIREIDQRGGAVAAVAAGFYQQLIAEAAFRHQREVERGLRKVVGVNLYCEGWNEVQEAPFQRISKRQETESVRALRSLRRRRDNGKASRVLARVRSAACQGRQLMPLLLQAARARCTVGEICGVLRQVFGTHQPSGRV